MKGDLERAIADFDQAVRLDPKSAAAFNDRGTSYGMRGDNDRAIADFDAAHQARSEERGRLQQPRLCLSQQRRHRPRHRRLQRGDQDQRRLYDRALQSRQRLLRQARPRPRDQGFRRGDQARSAISRPPITRAASPTTTRTSSTRRSRTSARRSSSIRRTRAPSTIAASPIATSGDFDRAIADYNQALAINPNYALALYNRGIAYYDKRDFDRATRDMNQAIKLNPNFSTAFLDRGIAYLRQARLRPHHRRRPIR